MGNQQFRLRILRPEDIPDLAMLMHRVWGFNTDAKFWQWKYFDSPFETKGYAVETEAGKIVAFTGIWLRHARVYGVRYRAWQLVDVMADPEYRDRKIYRFIVQEIVKITRKQNLILYGFTNEVSHALFYKYTKDILIVNETHKIYSLFINVGDLFNLNALVNSASGIINRGVVKILLTLSQPLSQINVERVNVIPGDLNRLCKNIENQYDMILEHNTNYLNWRFLNAPHQAYQVWTATINQQLVGYMVTALKKRKGRKTKGEIVDWLTPRQNHQVFNALLHHVLNWFLKKRTSVVDIWNLNLEDHLTKTLKRNLFIKGRREKSFLLAMPHPEKYQVKSDLERESFFTPGDAG